MIETKTHNKEKKMENLKKVTIKANGKIGELINKFDGTWDILIDGKCSGSAHYTDSQVKKIMETKKHEITYV